MTEEPQPTGAGAQDSEQPAQQAGFAERVGQVIAVVLLLVVATTFVWALIDIFPGDVREEPDGNFIDQIFASRAVIVAARIVLLSAAVVLLFGGVYIVWSIITWLSRGHLLEQAGPFRVSQQALAGLEEDVEGLRDALVDAYETNEELQNRLQERDQQHTALLELVQEFIGDGENDDNDDQQAHDERT